MLRTIIMAVLLVSPFFSGTGETRPERVGISSGRLENAFGVVELAVLEGDVPGAVALVSRSGRVVGIRSYGKAMLTPESRPMKDGTIFDLASLTKPIAAATSIMILVEAGSLRLDDKVSLFIPEFTGKAGANTDSVLLDRKRGEITIRQLLTHTSGLPAWRLFYTECSSYDEVIGAICSTDLENEPGTMYLYSDLGYMLLGEIVKRVSSRPLDVFAEEEIFGPLGMENTMFNPPGELWDECAATEFCSWRGRVLVGEVHDENAYVMGGVSGHAGLFSTAEDLAIFAHMMLNRGEYGGKRILSPLSIDLMVKDQIGNLGDEGLGWFTKSREFSSGGDLISESSYGHTGFTGTSIWMDPEEELVMILLTNRVHPTRENSAHIRLRPLFANSVAGAIEKSPTA